MTERVAGAVDIGGTKILIGMVDDETNVLIYEIVPTIVGESGGAKSADTIIDILEKQRSKIGIEAIEGIGIVCAGPLDSKTGVVENPYTLSGWESFPIVDYIMDRTGITTMIENDTNGMLLGEILLNDYMDKNVLMLTFGTGIGVSFFYNGKLLGSNSKYHQEMGHVIVDSEGPLCYCNRRGCFESLWSGTAINRRAMELGYTNFDDLYNKYLAGNAVANAFIKTAKRQLVNGIWNLMSILKPDILILGGGLMEKYYDFAKEAIENDFKDMHHFVSNYRICKVMDNGKSALIGAASLIFKNV